MKTGQIHLYFDGNEFIPIDEEKLISEVLCKIAKEKNKPTEKIKSLLIEGHSGINRRFWGILAKRIPGHPYRYIRYCTDCRVLELHESMS